MEAGRETRQSGSQKRPGIRAESFGTHTIIMSVRLKLVVIVLFVALIPLTISAFTALRVHRAALQQALDELQRDAAHYTAQLSNEMVDDAIRALVAVSQSIPWDRLSARERDGALSLIYQQLDEVAVVQLLDETGAGIGQSISLQQPSRDPELSRHPAVLPTTLEEFAAHIPFQPTRDDAALIGPAFIGSEPTQSIIPVAIRIVGPGDARWTVAIGLALSRICAEMRALQPSQLGVLLLDRMGRVLCATDERELLSRVAPGLMPHLANPPARLTRYVDQQGEMVAAVVAAANNWWVVVQQPASIADSAGKRMRNQTLFWIALSALMAVVAGIYLAQGISKPVRELIAGAEALAQGHYGYRLEASTRDEFGRLARAFNHMSREIKSRNHEIHAWNEELKKRVDDGTRELKEAQTQLLQSQKIAAVSSLAAGVAHEINNPLTGVLGFAQILRSRTHDDSPTAEALERIESEAKRIRDIVQTLLSFSKEYSGEGRVALDINEVVETALTLVASRIERRGVELVRNYCIGLPHISGNEAQLRQAILHVVQNSLAATSRGTISVSTEDIDGRLVKVVVRDTGRGIVPENLDRIFEPFFTTKEEWQGQGLGLTVAYRVIEQHHGTIKVDSTFGKGTTVSITLPAASGGAHLV
jgi:two-component system, NtrC family, sensor kinase